MPRTVRRRASSWLGCGLLVLTAATVHAAPVPWAQARFQYSTSGSTLAAALAELGRDEQVSISLEAGLAGQVVGRFNLAPQQFLELLARTYGLSWYYDGTTLQVTSAAAVRTAALRLNYADIDGLQEALAHTGLADSRFPLVYDSASGLIWVTGPARYVDLVGNVAQRLESEARAQVVTAVKIVKLNYAIAADRAEHVDGQSSPIPGVATRAKRLFDKHAAGGSVVLGSATAVPIEYEPALPVIEADARTNSVLIRDRAGKIDADAQSVSDLDRPPQLIAIETMVVEIDNDALASLPVTLEPSGPTATSAVVGHAGAALIARIKALSESHRARVDYERTTLTMDRVGAIADSHQGVAEDPEQQPPAAGFPAFSLVVVPTVVAAQIDLRADLDNQAGTSMLVASAPAGGPAPALHHLLAAGEALVVAHPLGAATLATGDGMQPHAVTRLAILSAHLVKAS